MNEKGALTSSKKGGGECSARSFCPPPHRVGANPKKTFLREVFFYPPTDLGCGLNRGLHAPAPSLPQKPARPWKQGTSYYRTPFSNLKFENSVLQQIYRILSCTFWRKKNILFAHTSLSYVMNFNVHIQILDRINRVTLTLTLVWILSSFDWVGDWFYPLSFHFCKQ